MPILQGAVLCDAATTDSSGKVSLLGGFVSALGVPQTPWPAPIHFAGRVGFDRDEVASEHVVIVSVEAPDGGTAAEVTLRVAPQDPESLPFPELAGGVNLVMPLPFPITQEGIYFIQLAVDGTPMARLPLKVMVGMPPRP